MKSKHNGIVLPYQKSEALFCLWMRLGQRCIKRRYKADEIKKARKVRNSQQRRGGKSEAKAVGYWKKEQTIERHANPGNGNDVQSNQRRKCGQEERAAGVLSAKEHGQQHNRQNDRQHQQQAAGLATGVALVPCRRPQLVVRAARVRPHVLDVVGNVVELLALFVHHRCHLCEQHVEVAHTLLNVADFVLALDNERLLKVDLVLRGQPCELLLLLELLLLKLLAAASSRSARCIAVLAGSGPRCRNRCLFLLERLPLQGLELG